MPSPLGYRADALKGNSGVGYLTVSPLGWVGGVSRCRRQIEPILGGFSHLGTPRAGHHILLQLTNQHVMSSEGSWGRIQTFMITARLRSAGKGSSSKVGWHHRSLLLSYSFTKDSLYRSYLPGNPPGARTTDTRNGGSAGYAEKGAEGSPATTGRTAADAMGAGEEGARRAAAICRPQRQREGEAGGFPSTGDFLRGLIPSQCATVNSWVPCPPLGPCPNTSSSPQRALAAERRLAAQLGAPNPQIPDSAIVNTRYVEGAGVMCRP